MRHIPSPHQLKMEFPPSSLESEKAISWRREVGAILRRSDPRLAILVGPCSIHDPEVALDYAKKLKKLVDEKLENIFLIMRLFFEKPRTRLGWKGILYDPFLDGSNDMAAGLRISRKLLLEITEIGLPCCTELLDPIVPAYFDDLITWGLIGARTSASQPHRQLASNLTIPVGFKNDVHGELDVAISGIISSRSPHSYIGIDLHGQIVGMQSAGNPLTHLVLRGSSQKVNYDPESIERALLELKKHHLEERVLVDCSHGNSQKIVENQKIVFQSVIEQAVKGNHAIVGAMLESHLRGGRQKLGEDPSLLLYGVSITDACLSWEETKELLLWANERLSHRFEADKPCLPPLGKMPPP